MITVQSASDDRRVVEGPEVCGRASDGRDDEACRRCAERGVRQPRSRAVLNPSTRLLPGAECGELGSVLGLGTLASTQSVLQKCCTRRLRASSACRSLRCASLTLSAYLRLLLCLPRPLTCGRRRESGDGGSWQPFRSPHRAVASAPPHHHRACLISSHLISRIQ